MSASFGIHFGTTSASLAVSKDGKTDVVANDSGDRVTPAVVAFTNLDQTVGLAAKQGIIRNSANTVCNVKQLIGKNYSDEEVQKIISTSAVKIKNKDGHPVYEVEYKEKPTVFEPKDIVAKIFKFIHDIADSHGDGDGEGNDAVLAVPIEFNARQKEELSAAAQKAGFNVLRTVSEPSAALLAYDLGQTDVNESSYVLVYRAGGTSVDVTVLAVCCGMYRVVASVSDDELGGRHMTDQLAQYAAGEFKRQWKMDLSENKRALTKLRNACEMCKHVLSTMEATHCSVDSLYEGIDFNLNISRARFEGTISSYVQRLLQPLDEVLKKAELQKEDIAKVVLAGGTSRIPLLQRQLAAWFPQSEVLCRLGPDDVIAIGAAKQASILQAYDLEEIQRNETQTEVPCVGADICMQVTSKEEGSSTELTVLSQLAPLPVRRQHKFILGPEQTDLCMKILQRETGSTCVPLAQLCVRDLTPESEVSAVFHMKSDGSLHVSCTESQTGRHEELNLAGPAAAS